MPPSRPPARRPTKRAPAPALDFARWIVWQDDDLVAIDKPAGVLSQGGEGGAGINLVDLARAYLRVPGIGVLHRLDRNVSGVVLIAKNSRAARAVTLEMQRGRVERVYRAVVRGEPREETFTIDAWLRKDERTNEVEARLRDDVVRSGALGFREARTEVMVTTRWRAPIGACAALEVRPITGRSHQIRVHLQHVGLPIVGDPKYGVAAVGVHRPLLHARAMTFTRPGTRERITVEARVPWDAASLATLSPGSPG